MLKCQNEYEVGDLNEVLHSDRDNSEIDTEENGDIMSKKEKGIDENISENDLSEGNAKCASKR